MNRTRIAAALAALIIAPLASCATVPDTPIVDGGPVRTDSLARLGEPTRLGLVVATPQKVAEDSRCPMNARCVWAGRVVVTTRIDGPGWRETVDLTLGEPKTVRGTSLALTSVRPERMAPDAKIEAQNYLFGFEGV
jgi:hypothetical protein